MTARISFTNTWYGRVRSANAAAPFVAKTPKQGRVDEYGLLVSVAAPPNYIEAEMVRRALEDAGIKATLAQTLAGPRLMVFPEDEARARKVVDQRR